MDMPTKHAETATREMIDPEEAHLTPEQRELLRSLERSLEQSERGEYRSVWEFLEELRLEREAEDNARSNGV